MFRSGNFWFAFRTYYNGAGKEMYTELKIAYNETGDYRIRYERS